MSDNTYNGWSNYETWCVHLWLTNEPNDWDEQAWQCVQQCIDDNDSDIKATAAYNLGEHIKEMVEESAPTVSGLFADLLNAAIGAVDWREIGAAFVDEVEVWSAGWNMPGYMPDNTPALFTDCDTARGYIADEIDSASEQEDDENFAAVLTADAETVRNGKGELGVTLGSYHYWITKE